VDLDAAVEMMLDLELMISDKAFIGQIFAVGEKKYQVETADNFEYSDPVDGTISRNQVILLYIGIGRPIIYIKDY